ncbi:hypothetical protein GGR55DRAFT_516483 [Xylaria sp. FL0064]|nr:hypothetical protein GGR55DRAFT_516483 [Xylaria sp. FL0064]
MARLAEDSTVTRPRTRARVSVAELSFQSDPEHILRESRRALRLAKAAERDLSHRSGDRSGERVLEAPIPEDVEPWLRSYEDIEQLRPYFSESETSETESSTSK